MKNPKLFLKILIFGFLLSFASCQQETSDNLEGEQNLIISNSFNYKLSDLSKSTGGWIISCSGSCGGGEACRVHHNGANQYAECTCTGCTLNVTIHNDKGQVTPASPKQYDEIHALDWGFNDFDKFIFEKYQIKGVDVISLEFLFSENAYSVMYTYEIDKEEKYILLVFELNEGRFSGASHTIECASSTCECRPRFVFNPPAAECTCSPCTMTVNEIKK